MLEGINDLGVLPQAVNAWIRTGGHFDAVVDFERIMADPAHPRRLRPEYDCGDHLHPSPAGYRAMAEAIPLELFAPARDPRAGQPPRGAQGERSGV